MTPKQERFIAEYVLDLNAAAAAARAGYSRKTAKEIGYQLLARPEIRAAVEERRKAIDDALVMSRVEVLRRLSAIGRADIRKLYGENGELRPVREWDDENAAAAAGIETEELFEGHREEREQVGYARKVKRVDQIRALELLGKHHALWNDQPPPAPEGPGMTIVVQNAVHVDGHSQRVTSAARVAVNLPPPER